METRGDPAAPRADTTQALARAEQPFRAFNIDLDDPEDRRFGDYELLEKIAGGGMGVVYRARQISLDREVALKLLAYDPFSADDMVSRFRDEARHAGRLQHPNIIPVYEIGTHENLYYFSMGLVRGPTLGHWLKQSGPRPPRQLAQLMRTIAEAVEYAHQLGTLHLDLKPGNVLIDERGAPQVGDFGLAHGIQEAEAGLALAAGTPAFMAPEQTRRGGSVLSTRTDVWGLGAILFQMLTGRPPFSGADADDTLRRVVTQPLVPPQVSNPKVPADLDAICRHCLAKDPADRYASAREMADDLQRFLDGRPVSVRAQGWPERLWVWRRREPRAAALALGLVLALLTGLAATSWLWVQAETSRHLAQHTLWESRRGNALDAQARGDALGEFPALVDNVAEAEAGGSAEDVRRDRLRIGLLMARAPRQIASFQFASEGRSVAFAEAGGLLLAGLRDGQLVGIDVASQGERWRITPSFPPTPWGPSFVGRIQPTADGEHALLYPSGSSGVARPDVSHMQRIELGDGALLAPPAAFADFSDMSFAPDGRSALLHDVHDGWQLWATDPWRASGQRFERPGTRYCLLIAGAAAACAEPGFKSVSLLDAMSGAARAELRFASGAELGAWSSSGDGRWLALGSAAGELLLHDLRTGASHRIADAGEDAIGDLDFAAGVLTVSNSGGSLRLLDLGERNWLTRPLRSGGQRINAAQFDAKSHWLLASDGRAVLWRLPLTIDASGALLPESVVRHRGALLGMHATALDGGSGLAASFGSEGELKLFRLPPAPTLAQRAQTLTAVSADLLSAAAAAEPSDRGDGDLPYLSGSTADGRYRVTAAGRVLLRRTPDSAAFSRIELPNSAQYLLVHAQRPLAVVASIEPDRPLRLRWRALDLRSGEWLAAAYFSEGLLDGVRFDREGRRLVWWQGQAAQVRRADDGQLLGAVEVSTPAQQISDVSLLGSADTLLLATSERSMLQPGTLQQWRIRADAPATLLREIHTPTAHNRVFDLGDSWFGHGPRVALYRKDQRIELADLGGDWNESAALSADRRWAAVSQRDAVRLYDLKYAQALLAPRAMSLPAIDTLSELGFSADGHTLLARSHFGYRFALPLLADQRPLALLRNEAHDLTPSRDGSAPAVAAAERLARDPGPPPVGTAEPAARSDRPLAADERQVDLRAVANVHPGLRFQGSRRGLGITDSASWPRGMLRLRGIDFDLGPALQLAPAGVSLGAAVFPEGSGPLPLPARTTAVHLLLSNQSNAQPDGLRLRWLDAAGNPLAESALSLPSAWDSALHAPDRGHQPVADVALIVRTAESRGGGGGSPQLFVYLVTAELPQQVGAIAAVELLALDAAPLLLALSVDGADPQ